MSTSVNGGEITICKSVLEYNELLFNARKPEDIKIAGMYNSYVDRILLAEGKNQGTIIYINVINPVHISF